MSDAILKRLRADKLPECSFDGGATWEINGVAVAEMLEEAAREIERLQDRLEMRHAYDIDGNKIAIEPGAIPDGIESRDDTIRHLEERNAHLRSERENAQRVLALAGKTISALDRENSRMNDALINIIDCDHHNHHDGPPPRYVQIARAAIRGDETP